MSNNKGPSKCLQMPEVANIIASKQYMHGYSDVVRERTRDLILKIDGSPADGGMTCISENDIPGLARQIIMSVDENIIADQWNPRMDLLRGKMRGLNQHCTECLSDCKDRVGLTRGQLRELSQTEYTNSRRSKVRRPIFDDATAE